MDQFISSAPRFATRTQHQDQTTKCERNEAFLVVLVGLRATRERPNPGDTPDDFPEWWSVKMYTSARNLRGGGCPRIRINH